MPPPLLAEDAAHRQHSNAMSQVPALQAVPDGIINLADHEAHARQRMDDNAWADRKSTRLNSSHLVISYAVFCLKKKREAGVFSTVRAPSQRSSHHSHSAH